MEPRLQFSIRNALLATTIIAAWCGVAVAAANYYFGQHSGNVVGVMFIAALVALPSMAVGALAGRLGIGILCGLASSGGYVTFYTCYYYVMTR